MSFDRALLATAIARVPSQVQQFAQGDLNGYDNCIPTSVMVARALYGLPVVDPQRETDGVYGRDYIGGESFWAAEAWIEANVGPPPAPVAGGQDLADLDAQLAKRFAVIGFFHCDADATINSAGPFYHASLVLDHQPDDWHVLNVHDHSEHHFSEAEMAAFTSGAGGFVYYQSALPEGADDMTPEEHATLQETHDKVAQLWADYVAGPRGSGQLPDELKPDDPAPVLAAVQALGAQVASLGAELEAIKKALAPAPPAPGPSPDAPALALAQLADSLESVKAGVDALLRRQRTGPVA